MIVHIAFIKLSLELAKLIVHIAFIKLSLELAKLIVQHIYYIFFIVFNKAVNIINIVIN